MRPVRMEPSTPFQRRVPVDRLTSRITAVEDVYVIGHMGIPRIDAADWKLRVDGLVEHPFELDYAALTALPALELTSVLECFGNPFEPELPTRKAANLRWRGARLSALLERAGVREEARYLWAEGLDHGTFAGETSDRYVKDIPLADALRPSTLVVWEMNGAPLTAEHGYPARLFVPGYFGTNQVKWLGRLTLGDARAEGLYTTRLYSRERLVDGQRILEPARDLDVISLIVSPAAGETLPVGAHTVRGWAWSADEIEQVEVSADGGTTWQLAELDHASAHPEWRRFEIDWRPQRAGHHELRARATDVRGRVQGDTGRNSVHAIEVSVV